MKHHYSLILTAILLLAAIGTTDAITRQQLAQYAQSLKGKKKEELKTALYNLMQPQKVLAYGSGSEKTWSGFYKTDRVASTNECINRYSNDKFYFSSGNTNRAISGMNIEHSFPKSWWGGDETNAYKDLYNLYPSESSANNKKSNYVMGEVTNPSILDDYEKVGYGSQGKVRMVEPHDNWKGDFCRSYFYMVTTYQDYTWTSEGLNCLENNTYPTLQKWAYTQYLSWCKNDKVDDIEVARNNAVSSIQGNRNLFIDFPYLAEYVWGDSVDVAFNPNASITTASDDERYGSYIPSPDNPDEPSYDGWIFAKINTQPTAGKRYLIVADNNGSLYAAKPVSPSKGKNYGYLYTSSVNDNNGKINITSEECAYTLEDANGGYYLKDSKGQYYYQDSNYSTFTPSTDLSKADVWVIIPNADGTFTIKASDSGNVIMYSPQYKSFGNYSSSKQSGNAYPYLYEEQEKTPTGINAITNSEIENQKSDNVVYNLQGVRVNANGKLRPGIYIKGGKKFVVK